MSSQPYINIATVELLAEELHRQYRAAEKSMNRAKTIWRAGVKIPNPNVLLHDHGFASCGKQAYFRKRARLILKRAGMTDHSTLGEAEETLNAIVLKKAVLGI